MGDLGKALRLQRVEDMSCENSGADTSVKILGPRTRGHLHSQNICHSKGKDKWLQLASAHKGSTGRGGLLLVTELIHFTPSHYLSGPYK